MSTKLTKQEVRNPDEVLSWLRHIYVWGDKHRKFINSAVILFLLVGVGLSTYFWYDEKGEQAAQEKYYLAHKKFIEKKQAAIEKQKDKDKPGADEKVDYSIEIKDLTGVYEEFPNKVAGKMAGLVLSQIYVESQNYDQAFNVLNRYQDKAKGLVNSLITVQKGNILAAQKKCTDAIETWKKVTEADKASYINPELYLRMGLCYEEMNDLTQAEQSYKKIIDIEKESASAKAAQKYLRLLALKKNQG